MAGLVDTDKALFAGVVQSGLITLVMAVVNFMYVAQFDV